MQTQIPSGNDKQKSDKQKGVSVLGLLGRSIKRAIIGEGKRKHWTEPMNFHPEVAEAFKVACAPTPRTRKPSVFGKTSLGHAWYPRLWHGPKREQLLDPQGPPARLQLLARPSRHARGVPGAAGTGATARTKPFEEAMLMPGGRSYVRRHGTLYRAGQQVAA